MMGTELINQEEQNSGLMTSCNVYNLQHEDFETINKLVRLKEFKGLKNKIFLGPYFGQASCNTQGCSEDANAES